MTEDLFDNSTIHASGGIYRPDTRTPEEQARDARRDARRQRVDLWKWRLRGLLPRGWKNDDDCGCCR